MSFLKAAALGVTLALGASSAMAIDFLKPVDHSRYFTQEEGFLGSLPRDIQGRYPRPGALGVDDRIPVGAYLPTPPNALHMKRSYALGEASVNTGHRRSYRDAKGRATRDYRHTAWRGDSGARRHLVD